MGWDWMDSINFNNGPRTPALSGPTLRKKCSHNVVQSYTQNRWEVKIFFPTLRPDQASRGTAFHQLLGLHQSIHERELGKSSMMIMLTIDEMV